ncbi:serine hydrolase domain-containing protein [Teichococcus vastitatis]|uniref:Serine hydrolase n=1 Tax=Teichococcus vastitatis TaxID=2307076 RepID=A0ABS9W1V9_9PROT|nr:serine hydrolase [Pseudoroseomonas vastitatis]MCI0753286.1 serine hydrolase [Pseudoroseomonas vastitatis]
MLEATDKDASQHLHPHRLREARPGATVADMQTPFPFEPVEPADAGFNPAALAEAVHFAGAHDSPFPRDLLAHLESGYFEPPPDNAVLGNTAPRGAPNGLILRGGRLVARWGDTRQVDMTFSVAKSYLALLAGLALGDGLIGSLEDRVSATVSDPAFAGERNGAITWRMLLEQTSEWEGTLFGKAERIDRGRDLKREGAGPKGIDRPLKAPGTYWEYNDVRVNALSLALLHRFRRPLPEVFAERITGPIGGSQEGRWEGYRTSVIEIDGRNIQSVSGGGHWGGGVFTHAEDQARIGQLMLQDGCWDGRRVLPEGWVAACTTPCALNGDYGLLWWLNRQGRYPDASRESFLAQGAGGNVIWIDPRHDLVAVFRWLDPAALPRMLGLVTAALAPG